MVAQALEKKKKKMTHIPKVAVVILNWNGKYFLEKFLPSVYNTLYPNVLFYIADNASEDGSVDYVRHHYSTIEIIQNDQNYGFAGGYNKALSNIDADYYVLLNSDVEVIGDWITPVIDYIEQEPDMVAAQPKIRSFHHRDYFEHAGAAGGFIDRYGYPFCRGRIMDTLEVDNGQYDDETDVFWATGAALFIKSDAWHKAGGFDEDFFAHMEEIDLCWRLQNMGYRVGYTSRSTVYHIGGGTLSASNPRKTYLNFRNNLIMLQKNLPLWEACFTIFIRFWMDLLALLNFAFHKKFRDAWAISRAHQDFVRYFSKNARKRKQYSHKNPVSHVFNGWIVWQYYLNKIQRFSNLPHKNFK